jgi:hypothetical protein
MLAVVGLFIVGTCYDVVAQNESGVRPLNPNYFDAVWLDSSSVTYEEAYPIIKSIPPIHSGMPYDVLQSYIYIDSLLRFARTPEIARKRKSWTSMNDTLSWLLYGLYVMKDYDPVSYVQYREEISNHPKKKPVDSTKPRSFSHFNNPAKKTMQRGGIERYYSTMYSVQSATWLLDDILTVPQHEKNALKALFYCDYILRVKVLSVDSMPFVGKSAVLNKNDYIYRAIAQVKDTIKGQVFKEHYLDNEDFKNSREGDLQTGQYPLITFTFDYRALRGRVVGVDYDPFPNNDPLFVHKTTTVSQDTTWTFMTSPGQEAIVFLKLGEVMMSSTHDYMDKYICAVGGCALPILKGDIVRDVNYTWINDKEQYTYADWKKRIQSLIQRILTRSY